MKSQRHFSLLFPEEMINGWIYFIFIRSLLLGIWPSQNNTKSDITILVYTPIKLLECNKNGNGHHK